jgi:hypothetical protein
VKKAASIILAVALLAGCATTPTTQNESNVTAKDYYETYYGKKTAERIAQKEAGANGKQEIHPQEAEYEAPDDSTTVGDVALTVLKTTGKVLLAVIVGALYIGAAAST